MRIGIGDVRGRAFWVVVGCLVVQMGLGYGYALGALAPYVLPEFGWTRTEWSVRAGFQLAATALSSPIIGALCVRWGTRGVITGGAFLLGTSFALYGSMQNLWELYGLTLLVGLGVTGIGDVVVGGVVPRWVVSNRGLALGVAYTGSNIGGWILTRLAAASAEAFGPQATFVLLGLGGAAVMLPFAWWAVRDPRPEEELAHEEPAPTMPPRGDADDMPLGQALRTRSFWILLVALFLFFVYFLAMVDFFVLYLTDMGHTRVDAARIYSWLILMGLIGKIGFGWMADRMSSTLGLTLIVGAISVSALLALGLQSPWVLPIFVLVYGTTSAARDVIYPLVIADCFGVRYLAQIYGAMSFTLWPAGTLGPIFSAWVHDSLGSYDVAFLTFAAANGLACAAFLGLRRETSRTETAEASRQMAGAPR